MVDWVADDQTSDTRPGLCGTSATREATKERKSSQVTDADKFRRVEVYLVPKGASQSASGEESETAARRHHEEARLPEINTHPDRTQGPDAKAPGLFHFLAQNNVLL